MLPVTRASLTWEWVSRTDLGIGQHGGIDLVLGAHDDIDVRKGGTNRRAVGAGIVPLVRPEVQVEDDGCAGLLGELRRIQGGAPARLFAQVRAGELKDAAPGDRCGQYVVDRRGRYRRSCPGKRPVETCRAARCPGERGSCVGPVSAG